MSSKCHCIIVSFMWYVIRGAFFICTSWGLPSLATGMVGSGVVVGGLVGGAVGTGTTRTHTEINTQPETKEHGEWACKGLDYTVQTGSCRGFILKVFIYSLHTALVRMWREDVASLSSVICLIMCLIKPPVSWDQYQWMSVYRSECMVSITSTTMFFISQILHSIQNKVKNWISAWELPHCSHKGCE